MSRAEYFALCGVASGYALYEHQTQPVSYQELINFVGDRLSVGDENCTLSGLSVWLLESKRADGSCSPDLDQRHVESVVLMSDLNDPDAFVSSLPEFPRMVVIPPVDLVRKIIQGENI